MGFFPLGLLYLGDIDNPKHKRGKRLVGVLVAILHNVDYSKKATFRALPAFVL